MVEFAGFTWPKHWKRQKTEDTVKKIKFGHLAPGVKHYCLGFLFSSDLKYVLLVQKKNPKWMYGRLNGIGGKLEKKDTDPKAAMNREGREELPDGLGEVDWRYRGLMSSPDRSTMVFVYMGTSPHLIYYFQALDWTDVIENDVGENMCLYRLDTLLHSEHGTASREMLLYNLNWLIPAVLDPDLRDFAMIGNLEGGGSGI